MTYRELGFKPFSICDTHVHMTARDRVDRSVRTLAEVMEYFGYERINIAALTTECGHGESDHANNVKAFYAKDALNGMRADSTFVYANPLYHLDERDTADAYLARVQELYAMGADGFKFLDGKPILRKRIARRLSDPIYDKMYAWFEEMGLPVLMHVTDPKHFWGPREGMTEYGLRNGWWCGDGSCPSFEALHEEVYELLDKFPRLKFTAAHCFFLSYDIDEMVAYMERWENTCFDLTPGAINFVEMSKRPDEWRAFFKQYSDRIFFGTDTYNTPVAGEDITKYERWTSPTLVRRMLEQPTDTPFEFREDHFVPLGLDDATLERIYRGNHHRLHPAARPLDRERIAHAARGTLEGIEARHIPYENEARYALEAENMRMVIARFSGEE